MPLKTVAYNLAAATQNAAAFFSYRSFGLNMSICNAENIYYRITNPKTRCGRIANPTEQVANPTEQVETVIIVV